MKTRLYAPLAAALLLTGCRGMVSENSPIHPNPNMDWQEKFEAQEANPLFADNRSMRLPVAGTIARGLLREDARLYTGYDDAGTLVVESPVAVSRELLLRGQQRYNIYCSVCHGKAGDGLGIIMTGGYGYTPAPSYHDERLRGEADGYFYNVISNGVRSMPGYAQQIAVADRWAIVSYVRALQRSQNASPTDVPAEVLRQIEQTQSANMAGGNTGQPAGGGTGGTANSTGATNASGPGAVTTGTAPTGAGTAQDSTTGN